SRVVVDRRPFKFSCSSTGRTTRRPTNSASVSHQILWGRCGSRLIQLLSDPRRAALRSRFGASIHEPPRATWEKRSPFGIRTGDNVGLSFGRLAYESFLYMSRHHSATLP